MANKTPKGLFSVSNSDSNYKFCFALLLNRIVNMFDWRGLPDTVDKQYLNYLLFCTGAATFFQIGNKTYIANCAQGGELNEYYQPEYAILANPKLSNGNDNLKIGTDCEVVYLSTFDKLTRGANTWGLLPPPTCPTYQLIKKYAELLADILTSLDISINNTRFAYLFVAPSDATKNSVELAMRNIYNGEPYVCVVDNGLLDNTINALPLTDKSNTVIRDLRESYNFVLSEFYHAIGIDSQQNYKRERLITSEVESDRAPLFINILDMKNSVVEGVEKVNKLFNLSVEVDLNEEFKKAFKNIAETDLPSGDEKTEESEVEEK